MFLKADFLNFSMNECQKLFQMVDEDWKKIIFDYNNFFLDLVIFWYMISWKNDRNQKGLCKKGI